MSVLVTVTLAIITSAGFWSVLQLMITRKGRVAEISRQDAETERLRQNIATGAIEKQKLMAEVESVALAAADIRYEKLETQSGNQREVMVTLVDVLETLVFRMRAAPDSENQIVLKVSNEEYLTARAALNKARTHLR